MAHKPAFDVNAVLEGVLQARRERRTIPSLKAVAATGKGRLHSSAATHLCMAAMTFKGIMKPIGQFKLFTGTDGKQRLMTAAAVDSGEVAAAGIKVIDGDKEELRPQYEHLETIPSVTDADEEPIEQSPNP